MRRHHLLFAALVAGASGLALSFLAVDALRHDAASRAWLVRRPAALPCLWAFALVSIAALAHLLLQWRRGRWRSTSYAPLRWSAAILLAAWASLWCLEPPMSAQDGHLALSGAAATWSAAVTLAAQRSDRPWPRWFRVLDVLACELAACAFLAEAGLRLARRAAELPILATAGTNPDAWLRTYRLEPGRFRYGFPVNREGFVDVEPEQAARAEDLVVSIGDSFSVGVVPHPWHYTRVAEQSFLGLEIYNAGVVHSGPREYLRILETSALPLRPDLIVVALFLGNDLEDAERGDPTVLSTWMDRGEILVLQGSRRLWNIARERWAGASIADPEGATRTQGLTGATAASLAEMERRMPWLSDPSREPPAVSARRFAEVEADRAEYLVKAPEAAWTKLFSFLERMQRAAGPVPVACLLIPDEFQVEDRLWGEVRKDRGLADADRDLPQRRLAEWCSSRRMPYLDLLPALRAVPPVQDGVRHVYHRRDTHWNARGNRVAGEALAAWIERLGVASRVQ